MCTSLSMNSLSRSRSSRSLACWPRATVDPFPVKLEGEARFARGVGERLHPPMIEIAAAVEHDLLHPRLDRPLGHELADCLGGGKVAPLQQRSLEVLVKRRGRRDCLARPIVDHLRVNVSRGAEYRQARARARCTLDRAAHPA